jgi:hypothetical protein
VPTDDDDDDKPVRATSAAEEITDLPEVEDDDKLNKELKWDEEERPEDVEGEEGGESRGPSRRR